MAETKIEWSHYSFNPWRGCTKVNEACTHCYADALSKRNPSTLGVWGPRGTRVIGAPAYWKQALAWNRDAEAAGERRRVFCASLADVFEKWDGPMMRTNGERWGFSMADARLMLFDLIDQTPWLDWLLLTKRPENIRDMWTGGYRANVWRGMSVGLQKHAENIPHLIATNDLSPVAFLSCEPLLSQLDLDMAHSINGPGWLSGFHVEPAHVCGGDPEVCERRCPEAEQVEHPGRIHWTIIGGESGPGARPCDVDWIRSLVEQCKAAGVPAFVKQLGAKPREPDCEPGHVFVGRNPRSLHRLRDPKGGDPDEWPDDLRVREVPQPAKATT